MKLLSPRLLSSLVIVIAFYSSAAAAIERTVEKSFTVAACGLVRLETQGGDIRVIPGPDGVVKITAREKIRANSDAEADELLKKLELTFDQSGNDVTARSKYERAAGGFHFGSWPPVQVDFLVTTPAASMTDVHTSGGRITLGDLGGKVQARTSGGDIALGKIGAAIDARTSGGNIALESAQGPVALDTSGGNISAGRVAGAAVLSTSGGNIRIESVENSLRAHTSGGNVQAAIAGPLHEDCSLSTSGGTVRVTVAATAAFRLDASTSGGSVDAAGLTIKLETSDHSHSKLVGAVNGGGPLLKLRSSGGNIVVKTQ